MNTERLSRPLKDKLRRGWALASPFYLGGFEPSPDKPQISRREFFRLAVAAGGTLLFTSACEPSPPPSGEKPGAEKLAEAIRKKLENQGAELIKVQAMEGGLTSLSELTPIYVFPWKEEEQDPFQFGLIGASKTLSYSYRITSSTGSVNEPGNLQVWDATLHTWTGSLPGYMDTSIPGWEEEVSKRKLEETSEFLVDLEGEVVFFVFNPEETREANQNPENYLNP